MYRFKVRGQRFDWDLTGNLLTGGGGYMETIEVGTITPFKIHLDMYIEGYTLEEFGSNASKWD